MKLSIDFRYTSITESAAQNTPENSLGGYTSTNNIYDSASLTDNLNETSTLVPVSSLPVLSTGLSVIDTEIVKYSSVDSSNYNLVNVSRGMVPNIQFKGFPHVKNEPVNYLTVANLFNPKFDTNYCQYRCLAIKNKTNMSVNGVKFIVINDNFSNTTIDAGIESPKHNYLTGIITDVSSGLMFSSSYFSGTYSDNYFSESLIRITSGTSSGNYAIISSYDDATGTFIVNEDLGTILAGNTFEIEASPSQTVINQFTKPLLNNGRFAGFISEGGSNEFNNIFSQNEIIYLWIKRTIKKNVRSGNDTAALILFQYNFSGS
jgi:hypothetical protein